MESSDLHSTVDLGKISVGHHLGWLVADTDFESCGAPVDELDGSLRLEGSDCIVRIVWNNVTSVEQAGSHVFPVARITLDHLVVRFEARH